MLGTRGIWQDGWKAVAVHAPLTGKGHFDKDQWELYHVDAGPLRVEGPGEGEPGEARGAHQGLVRGGGEEPGAAARRSQRDGAAHDRAAASPSRRATPYVYYPGTSPVPEGVAVNIRGRSYKILADVEITDPNASGVIFAHGSRFGGHALFIKDKKLHYVYNFLGIKPEQKFVSPELKPGKYTLGMEFIREAPGKYHESVGKTKLYVDDKVVAEGPMRTQVGKFTLSGDGLCIGRDSGDNVSQEYKAPGTFKGGTILGVGVNVGDEQYLDLEKEAAAAFAVE